MQGLTHPSSGRQFIWLEQFSILFTEKNLGGGEKNVKQDFLKTKPHLSAGC